MTTMVRQPQVWTSFDEFVRTRGAALWRSAWLLTGDRQRAEDLVQEALTRCWPHFDRLNTGHDSFEAYVRTAIHRQHLAWWRRGGWRELTRDASGTPDTARPDQGQDADLGRALADLSRRQRSVLVLRYFDDLTEAQTAQVLGITVGAVKQHAHRGLAALRGSPHLGDDLRSVVPHPRTSPGGDHVSQS